MRQIEEINKKIERKCQDKIFTPDEEIHHRAQYKGNNLGVAEHLNFIPELGYPGGGDHRQNRGDNAGSQKR